MTFSGRPGVGQDRQPGDFDAVQRSSRRMVVGARVQKRVHFSGEFVYELESKSPCPDRLKGIGRVARRRTTL